MLQIWQWMMHWNKDFEIQLLLFCHNIYELGYYDDNAIKNDIVYTRSNYILDSVYIAQKINLSNSTHYSKEQVKLIKAYQYLGELRERLIKSLNTTTRGTPYTYLPVKSIHVEFLRPSENQRFDDAIKVLSNNDVLFNNDIFNFKRNFIDKDMNQKIQSLHSILVEDFFEIKDFKNYPKVTINGNKERVKPILRTYEFSSTPKINLIEPADFDQDYMRNLEEFTLENTDYTNMEEYFNDLRNLMQ